MHIIFYEEYQVDSLGLLANIGCKMIYPLQSYRFLISCPRNTCLLSPGALLAILNRAPSNKTLGILQVNAITNKNSELGSKNNNLSIFAHKIQHFTKVF